MRFPLVLLFGLTVATAIGAQEPTAPPCPAGGGCADATGTTGFFDRFGLSIGLGVFGETFPVSSAKISGSSQGQFSLLGGARFLIGTQVAGWFRVLGVFEFGYASSGASLLNGSQGLMEGAGLELTFERLKWVKPFVRFMYDAQVVSIRSASSGALAYSAYFVSAGVRVRIVDVHLSVGRDFSGGVSPGLGFGFNWLY